MKLRSWAIIAGMVIIAAGSALYEAKLYLEKKQRLEYLVVQAVSPYINGSFRVGKINFGFFSAHLRDITLDLPADALAVSVDDIKVKLSPLKLVRSHFSIAKSISEIILVGPAIDVSLEAHSPLKDPSKETAAVGPEDPVKNLKPPASPQKPPVSASRIASLPVRYLSVKKGTLRVKDGSGQVTVLGEQLEGKMWETGTELTYDLAGKLGAERRNLFVKGRFSWRGEKHRISLTLSGADVTKPFAFRGVQVLRGSLSGVLEAAFSDTVSLAGIDVNGWIKVGRGTFRIDRVPKPVDSVALAVTITDTRLAIDSASGTYAGAEVKASGTWDLRRTSRTTADRIDFECRNICADSVVPPGDAPRDARARGKDTRTAPRTGGPVAGFGWLRGTIMRQWGADVTLSANAGGVTVWGVPVLGVFANVKFRNKQVTVDSLSVRLPSSDISWTGDVDYSMAPLAYSFHCAGSLDSLGLLQKECGGDLHFVGEVQGVGDNGTGVFTVLGNKIRYSDVPLSSFTMSAKVRGDSVVFHLRNNDRTTNVQAAGVLSRLAGKHPKVCCTLSVKALGSSPLFLKKMAQLPPPDSMRASVTLNGWEDSFRARITADIDKVSGIHGQIEVNFDRNPAAGRNKTLQPVSWRLTQGKLAKDGIPIMCSGAGRLYGDSAVIDSLVLFDRTCTTGKIMFSPPGARFQLECIYNVPIKESIRLFYGGPCTAIDGGTLSGTVRVTGPFDKIETGIEAHVRDLSIGGFGKLQTDAIITTSGTDYKVRPFVLRKDEQVVAEIDTIASSPHFRCAGRIDDLDLRAVFGALLPEDIDLRGLITGSFRSTENGFPITVTMSSPKVAINACNLDSVQLTGAIDTSGILVRKLRAVDGSSTVATANGYVPWALLRNEATDNDTMQAVVSAKGDLIATLRRNTGGLVDGTGQGTCSFSISGQPENWHVKEASFQVPKGTLLLKPYIAAGISNFSCDIRIGDFSRVSTLVTGTIKKRPLRIFSTHLVPDGYEPLLLGPLDFGVLQLETPRHGIDLHVPGLMERGETGDVEPAGRGPFSFFTLAGPVTNLNIVGTVIVRSVEFTYPMLADREKGLKVGAFSPTSGESSGNPSTGNVTSLIKWELDIKAGDHEVVYFRDIANKKTRLMRVFEATVDQGSSIFRLRGSEFDKTFKISGIVHSYKGVVYYGKTFDRNFDAGVEFIPQKNGSGSGYDNFPIIWGSAEAFADSGRFDRIKLTALIQDPMTGVLAEKGRLAKKFNLVVHVSSDFEGLPGESERDFYRQAGLQFTTLGGAGKAVSDFGEQTLHRMFLQKFERKLAKTIGLDVINIETSIASNYFNRFYSRQFINSPTAADYLALANVGVTVGRYILGDNVFLKARGGLLPKDTSLTPEYSLGIEFQPTRYFFMDFDYGFYKGDLTIEQNPRFNLQLRLPISGLRKYLDF